MPMVSSATAAVQLNERISKWIAIPNILVLTGAPAKSIIPHSDPGTLTED